MYKIIVLLLVPLFLTGCVTGSGSEYKGSYQKSLYNPHDSKYSDQDEFTGARAIWD